MLCLLKSTEVSLFAPQQRKRKLWTKHFVIKTIFDVTMCWLELLLEGFAGFATTSKTLHNIAAWTALEKTSKHSFCWKIKFLYCSFSNQIETSAPEISNSNWSELINLNLNFSVRIWIVQSDLNWLVWIWNVQSDLNCLSLNLNCSVW